MTDIDKINCFMYKKFDNFQKPQCIDNTIYQDENNESIIVINIIKHLMNEIIA